MKILQSRIQPVRSGYRRIRRIAWYHEADKTIPPEFRCSSAEIHRSYGFQIDIDGFAAAGARFADELSRVRRQVELDLIHSIAIPEANFSNQHPSSLTYAALQRAYDTLQERASGQARIRPVEVPISDERVMIQQQGSYTRSIVRNDARATSEQARLETDRQYIDRINRNLESAKKPSEVLSKL